MDEAEGCEARALHLWQIAIPQLERIAAGSSLNKHQKTNLIFDFPMLVTNKYFFFFLIEIKI